jgi:hypothetical protein
VNGGPQVLPDNADFGRRAYFEALIRSRVAAYALVTGCIAAFLLGAARGEAVVMVAGPVGLVLLVILVTAFLADRRAAESFFESFARALGLEYVGRWEIAAFTPLLAAGNRQWCEHWMLGDVVKEPPLAGGLGHFLYERRKEHVSAEGNRTSHTVERGHFTVCVVDVEPSMLLFKGVFLRQRRGLFEFRTDWLSSTPSRRLAMESAAFTDRYELRIAEDQDEVLLRQLLSPSLVSWLAAHPLSPGFELRAGTLVVFVPGALDDAGKLTMLVDAARRLARRVTHEVDEASSAIAVTERVESS